MAQRLLSTTRVDPDDFSATLLSSEPPGPTSEPQAGPDKPSQLLAGRYCLDSVIATGGMGVVVGGHHVLLERPVAVKFLRSEMASSDALVERFLREGRAAARLRTPHVVQVLDVGVDDSGTPFLVMERLDGDDLATILDASGPLELSCAVDYTLQACRGIAAAHRAGLVHRDIKPENLFLTRCDHNAPNTIKVLDFGIVKDNLQTPLTRTGDEVGSPRYMAPEQVLTPGNVDARADIWSLGTVLFELLTARYAFDGATVPAIWAAVLQGSTPDLRAMRPDAPKSLECVIGKCLAKRREDRYQSAEELVVALELVSELEFGQ